MVARKANMNVKFLNKRINILRVKFKKKTFFKWNYVSVSVTLHVQIAWQNSTNCHSHMEPECVYVKDGVSAMAC